MPAFLPGIGLEACAADGPNLHEHPAGLCGVVPSDRQWCAPAMAVVGGLMGAVFLSMCAFILARQLHRKRNRWRREMHWRRRNGWARSSDILYRRIWSCSLRSLVASMYFLTAIICIVRCQEASALLKSEAQASAVTDAQGI